MDHKEIITERFILRILKPEMVTNTYLSWFFQDDSSVFISYSKNPNLNLKSLKEYVGQKFYSPDALFFGIFSRVAGNHIGNIKFEPIDLKGATAVMGVLIGDPKWRGLGVFSEVDQALEKSLIQMGIKQIWLGVHKKNKAAIRAYEKAGYQISHKNFLNVVSKEAVCMAKYLEIREPLK